MTPLCGYTLDYRIQIKDLDTGVYTPLPSWLANVANLDFSVYSDDPSTVAVYHISIIGSVPSPFMDPTYEEELLIRLTVNNDCQTDKVTPLDTIPDELYYIAEDGVRTFAPSWSITVIGCPVTYEIGRIDESTGLERPLGSAELAVIDFNGNDGQMSYQTSNYELDGEVWTIRLYKKSTYSIAPEQEGEYLFDIEFKDICWVSDLVAAEFSNTDYVFDLWQF